MALPLIPLSVAWGAKTLINAIEYTAVGLMVYDYFFDEEIPEETSNIVIDSQPKQLLEDIIFTNKANLILRNVRQDIYEPLNIDAT